MVGLVGGVVDVGFVEDHSFAVAPGVVFAVYADVAGVVVRRVQAQVVAVGAGIRVAVAYQFRARWQGGEHRRFDAADALQEFGGARAEFHRRRVTFAVPLQVEALPAALEEGVETDVVVVLRTFDFADMQQLLGFGADFLPVVLQRLEFGEGFDRQVGLGRELGEQVEEHVHRREEA
ncbi:hypothetical protein D9M71_537120 [compost metagenome]